MIGNSDSLPWEDWNLIPDARGCTPQSCAFKDNYDLFKELNVQIFGVSSQGTNEQLEAKNSLHLPFGLVSDPLLILNQALRLPTFEIKLGNTLE